MYASSLSIYDFKCFGKAVLRLQHPSRRERLRLPNVNLVLGDNGGGKSSVLRGLAVAVLAPVLLHSGFVPYRLVRRGGASEATQALVKVEAVFGRADRVAAPSSGRRRHELLARIDRATRGDLDRLHLESTPQSPLTEMLFDDASPACFVVGYGATRRVETGDFSMSSARRTRGLRYQRVAGLFEDQVTLQPLLQTFTRANIGQLSEMADLLNRVLPAHVRFDVNAAETFDGEAGQYLFRFGDAYTPFSALSDGYKAFIGWVTDLMAHLMAVATEGERLDSIAGIVLVDEIDLHLHPEWQRSVVPALAAAFPKLQFVFTSHSPLVAASVERENIFVTDTAADGTATIRQYDEYVFGRSPDELLLSPYFGLSAIRPETVVNENRELFMRAAQGDSGAALEYLDRLAAPVVTAPARRATRRTVG